MHNKICWSKNRHAREQAKRGYLYAKKTADEIWAKKCQQSELKKNHYGSWAGGYKLKIQTGDDKHKILASHHQRNGSAKLHWATERHVRFSDAHHCFVNPSSTECCTKLRKFLIHHPTLLRTSSHLSCQHATSVCGVLRAGSRCVDLCKSTSDWKSQLGDVQVLKPLVFLPPKYPQVKSSGALRMAHLLRAHLDSVQQQSASSDRECKYEDVAIGRNQPDAGMGIDMHYLTFSLIRAAVLNATFAPGWDYMGEFTTKARVS
jgi:hypothetical protein